MPVTNSGARMPPASSEPCGSLLPTGPWRLSTRLKSRISRRWLLASAAASTAALPLSSLAAPSCTDEGGNDSWFLLAYSSRFTLLSQKPVAASGPLVRLVGDHKPRFAIDVFPGAVKLSGNLPGAFSVGDTSYAVAQTGSGKDAAIHLTREQALVQPPLLLQVVVDNAPIVTRAVEWEGSMLSSRDGQFSFEISISDHAEQQPVIPALRSGASVIVVIEDITGAILDQQGPVVAIIAELAGLDSAWKEGEAMSAQLKKQSDREECEGDCFLTTACCQGLRRPDRCWELETLRWFRDEVLVGLPGGADDIAEYYRLAPAILDAFPQSGFLRWFALVEIYVLAVLPCALLVKASAYRPARWLYSRRVSSFKRRYPAVEANDS